MITEHRAVAALRIFLVLLFGVLVVFQTLSFPGQFAYMAREEPDDAALRWPLTFVAAFFILCVQVVIVCTWQLLTLVKHDQIFTAASMRWVNGILWATGAAWVGLVGVSSYVVATADDPGAPMMLLLLLTSVTVFGLLMVVLRALLHRATTLRDDMESVI